jgi:hypothetical protein
MPAAEEATPRLKRHRRSPPVVHRLLLTPMQNVVAIHCRRPDHDQMARVGMLVVEAGTTDAEVLVTPPMGGAAFWLTLPDAVLNQGQRYVGHEIRTALRPLS